MDEIQTLPDGRKVIWYPTRPERFVVDLAEYAQPPADRVRRLTAALREIKQLVDDAPALTVTPEHIFDAIWAICKVALEDDHA